MSSQPPVPQTQAKITLNPSNRRVHIELGWLDSYHGFTANKTPAHFFPFGSLTALGEDRVQPQTGFPTHHHKNFEIFTYVLSGELTHRDSMLTEADAQQHGDRSEKFYRIRRNDLQFTTAGTGISHSEMNEHEFETVHLLQIWVIPWKKGLTPRYHSRSYDEAEKKKRFLRLISPLKAGANATPEQEEASEPTEPGTIPIHADFVMGAGIITPGAKFGWEVGAGVTKQDERKVYIHLAMTKNGEARVRLDVNGTEHTKLNEGDGAFVEGVAIGDKLHVESVGSAEAEVVVLDTSRE